MNLKFHKYNFLFRGSDERQFNSPGVELPISSILRTKYGKYKEYHTSLDDFSLVTKKGLSGGFNVAKQAILNLMKIEIPKTNILCEPMLQKKNLYQHLSTNKYHLNQISRNILNFLQYSDGKNSLTQIYKLIKLSFFKTKKLFLICKKKKLIL